jgi:hypothetical protein
VNGNIDFDHPHYYYYLNSITQGDWMRCFTSQALDTLFSTTNVLGPMGIFLMIMTGPLRQTGFGFVAPFFQFPTTLLRLTSVAERLPSFSLAHHR